MKFASDARVFVALGAVDLRWGFDTLAALVVALFERDPRHGALHVLRIRTTLRALFFQRSRICVVCATRFAQAVVLAPAASLLSHVAHLSTLPTWQSVLKTTRRQIT
jgi:IS66 Orf2 like protein